MKTAKKLINMECTRVKEKKMEPLQVKLTLNERQTLVNGPCIKVLYKCSHSTQLECILSAKGFFLSLTVVQTQDQVFASFLIVI